MNPRQLTLLAAHQGDCVTCGEKQRHQLTAHQPRATQQQQTHQSTAIALGTLALFHQAQMACQWHQAETLSQQAQQHHAKGNGRHRLTPNLPNLWMGCRLNG